MLPLKHSHTEIEESLLPDIAEGSRDAQRKKRVILIIVLSFLVVVTAVVATGIVYFVFTKNTTPEVTETPTVILISLDGFRWDYLDMYKDNTPVLNKLRQEGTYSAIQPMFPTKTFPNHYTIVTGLYPESHGIIGNTMYDPVFNETFTLSNGAALQAKWWGGEPLWSTVQKKGLKSGIYFWPGSEAPIGGVLPSYYKPYNKSVPMGTRADGVIQWLEMPEGERPHFLAVYMEAVDDAGHWYGPFSPLVGEAAGEIDAAIGRLMDYLYASGKFNNTNLIITADHGMTLLDNSRVILLDQCIDMSLVTVVDWSPNCFIIPKDNSTTQAIMASLAQCKEKYPNMTAYLKDEIPARFNFNNSRRITPIVIIADLGWSITQTPPGIFNNTGNHGFDNINKDMWGLFLAHGPNIIEGVQIDHVPNLEIYNFITHVLHVPGAPNNGTSFLIDQIYAE